MIDPKTLFQFQSRPEESEEETYVLTWMASHGLPYFDGHFPQNPVLPAIAVLDGTLEALKLIQQDTMLSFEKIRLGKFLNKITPGTAVQIRLTRVGEGEWEALWGAWDGKKIFAHLKLSLKSSKRTCE